MSLKVERCGLNVESWKSPTESTQTAPATSPATQPKPCYFPKKSWSRRRGGKIVTDAR